MAKCVLNYEKIKNANDVRNYEEFQAFLFPFRFLFILGAIGRILQLFMSLLMVCLRIYAKIESSNIFLCLWHRC